MWRLGKSPAILVAGLFLFWPLSSTRADAVDDLMLASSRADKEKALQALLKVQKPGLAEKLAFASLGRSEDRDLLNPLTWDQRDPFEDFKPSDCKCSALKAAAKSHGGRLCDAVLGLNETKDLKCDLAAPLEWSIELIESGEPGCLSALAEDKFDLDALDLEHGVTDEQLFLAQRLLRSKNEKLSAYAAAIFNVLHEQLHAELEQETGVNRSVVARIEGWLKGGSKERSLAAVFIAQRIGTPNGTDPYWDKLGPPFLKEYYKALSPTALPWSPRFFFLSSVLWASDDAGARALVAESPLGAYFKKREVGFERVLETPHGIEVPACSDLASLAHRLESSVSAPEKFQAEEKLAWKERWMAQLETACGSFGPLKEDFQVASYRSQDLYYCSSKYASVWKLTDGLEMLKKELDSHGAAGVLSVNGTQFLMLRESYDGPDDVKGVEGGVLQENLYEWTGQAFARVFAAGQGDRYVCGSGPVGVWTDHGLGQVKGRTSLISHMEDGAYSIVGEDEWTHGDVRYKVEPLSWDSQGHKISVGPPEYYYSEEIEGNSPRTSLPGALVQKVRTRNKRLGKKGRE